MLVHFWLDHRTPIAALIPTKTTRLFDRGLQRLRFLAKGTRPRKLRPALYIDGNRTAGVFPLLGLLCLPVHGLFVSFGRMVLLITPGRSIRFVLLSCSLRLKRKVWAWTHSHIKTRCHIVNQGLPKGNYLIGVAGAEKLHWVYQQ